MKLKELISHLQDLAKQNPEALEYDVVYSVDEEGNGFGEVQFVGGVGCYKDSDFISDEHYKADPEYYKEAELEYVLNAVCIN